MALFYGSRKGFQQELFSSSEGPALGSLDPASCLANLEVQMSLCDAWHTIPY